MTPLGTLLHTWIHGKFVGEDEFGNKYYELRRTPKIGRRTRWVLYNGIAEASKVPAAWHGWLHYTHEKPMSTEESRRWPWQKMHLPNLTGTRYAYMPSGHILKKGKADRAVSDYEAWKP